jgi:hypothetical protein
LRQLAHHLSYKVTKGAGRMMTDFRFPFRQLLKSPGLTLLALITLALGIGLNTAMTI